MKMVKSLLLGSAAGFATIAVAQAADLPVKAKPVEYVKVCSLYGEGFWYVPGTDTCMKIGAFVRMAVNYNIGNGGAPFGQGAFSDTNAGNFTRTDTNSLNFLYAGVMSLDIRTQTEYGTLRSYMDLGTQQVTVGHWGGGSSGLSTLGSIPTTNTNGPNGALATTGLIGNGANNYFNESTFVTRAFIQFAGITAGRIRSFFDINSMGPYDLSGNRIQGDTAGVGVVGIAYTAQLGNGVSASVALEDGGDLIYGRGFYVLNANFSTSGAFNSSFGPGLGASADNSSVFSLDPVVALRIDQAWGYAQISGALHGDSGGYYGSVQQTGNGFVSGIDAGHPGDKFGWATSAGFTLTNFLGMRGDTAGAQVAYCMGAQGYCNHSNAGSFLYGAGNKITFTQNADGVYTTGTGVSLTTNWSVTAFYEHIWNAQWRTSVFGGYTGINYSAAEQTMLCPMASPGAAFAGIAPGAIVGAGTNIHTWNAITFLPGDTCNPNYNTWQVGSRTMWNPVPMLDIGVEVIYTGLNQSNSGNFVFSGNGAINPGIFNFANQGVWAGLFRIQRNFLY
jgi:hypothetical protein